MPKQFEEAAIHAARRGNGLHKWVEDKTASGSLQVLTEAELVKNIPEGFQVMLTGMVYNLETVSDDCEFEVVSTDAADGAGSATRLHAYSHIFTGTTPTPAASQQRIFNPPVRIRYSDGHRSVTMRIDANDSSAVVSCGWDGWLEKEL